MMALGDYRNQWSQLERWKRRLAIAAFFFLESTLGLLSQMGALNLVDMLLFDGLPPGGVEDPQLYL